jgi:hypothetical protein
MNPPAENFDPYLKWLGIRDAEQPPNMYRLLGIELFEHDPDVIANAADARMAHLKTFQTGQYSKLSQKLLNEVAAAKVCLLNAGRKAEYDESLRKELAPPPRTPPAATGAIPPPPPAKAQPVAPGMAGQAQPSSGSAGPPPLPSRADAPASAGAGFAGVVDDVPGDEPAGLGRWPLWLGVALVTAMLVAALGYFVVQYRGRQIARENGEEAAVRAGEEPGDEAPSAEGPSEKQPDRAAEVDAAADDDAQPTSSTDGSEPQEAESQDPDDQDPDDPESGDTASSSSPFSEVDPDEAADDDEPDEPVEMTLPPADESSDEEPADGETSEGEQAEDDSDDPSADDDDLPPLPTEIEQTWAVPNGQELREARELVNDVFGNDMREADSPAQKRTLAARFYQQARRTRDDKAARYVLYRLASQWAAASGSLFEGLDIIDRLAEEYEINRIEAKVELLTDTIKASRGSGTSAAELAIPQTALALAEEAIAEDELKLAQRLANMALPGARRQRDAELVRRAVALDRDIERLERGLEGYREAQATLEQTPDDPEANLRVGMWQLAMRGDAEKALPHLARGSDEPLAEVAAADLQGPGLAKEQTALAEAWWQLAEKQDERTAAAMKRRAGVWYERALPQLSDLEKVAAQKRLEAIAELESAAPARGALRPGDVALATRGAQVDGPVGSDNALIDGNTTNYSSYSNVARGNTPCQWTITLDRVYKLREIRFKLYERSNTFYRYRLSVSADGEEFRTVADRSQGQWFGWQRIRFSPRPVKAIRLTGLFCNTSSSFRVVELEAYCIPPAGKQ